MHLWFRIIWLIWTARARGALTLPDDTSRVPFRVMPHDLDISMHMNNGRYLTIMDLGRFDIMLRSGLWSHVWKRKWTPIASAITIRFRRELRPFQKYFLDTRIMYWDETVIVMEQTFVIDGGERDGQVAARGLFKGGIYDRNARAFVPMAELMKLIGISAKSPRPTPEVAAFLSADAELKQATAAQ